MPVCAEDLQLTRRFAYKSVQFLTFFPIFFNFFLKKYRICLELYKHLVRGWRWKQDVADEMAAQGSIGKEQHGDGDGTSHRRSLVKDEKNLDESKGRKPRRRCHWFNNDKTATSIRTLSRIAWTGWVSMPVVREMSVKFNIVALVKLQEKDASNRGENLIQIETINLNLECRRSSCQQQQQQQQFESGEEWQHWQHVFTQRCECSSHHDSQVSSTRCCDKSSEENSLQSDTSTISEEDEDGWRWRQWWRIWDDDQDYILELCSAADEDDADADADDGDGDGDAELKPPRTRTGRIIMRPCRDDFLYYYLPSGAKKISPANKLPDIEKISHLSKSLFKTQIQYFCFCFKKRRKKVCFYYL